MSPDRPRPCRSTRSFRSLFSFPPFLAFLLLVPLSLVGTACGDDDGACSCPADPVINCGHRGTGSNDADNPFPENTLPSFEQAELEGADMVELDVQRSADGALVVMHDDTVDRTTDGTGCVQDLTLTELQGLDAAVGTSLEGTGVTVPTLQEVLDAVTVDVNVEIKINDTAACPASDRAALASDLAATLGADTGDRRVVVSSFDLDVLLELQALDPGRSVGYLSLLPSDASVAADEGLDALNVLGGLLNEQDVALIRDAGLDVNVWTVNDPADMERLFGYGVNMIITDEPDQLAATRQTYCEAYCGGSD